MRIDFPRLQFGTQLFDVWVVFWKCSKHSAGRGSLHCESEFSGDFAKGAACSAPLVGLWDESLLHMLHLDRLASACSASRIQLGSLFVCCSLLLQTHTL